MMCSKVWSKFVHKEQIMQKIIKFRDTEKPSILRIKRKKGKGNLKPEYAIYKALVSHLSLTKWRISWFSSQLLFSSSTSPRTERQAKIFIFLKRSFFWGLNMEPLPALRIKQKKVGYPKHNPSAYAISSKVYSISWAKASVYINLGNVFDCKLRSIEETKQELVL